MKDLSLDAILDSLADRLAERMSGPTASQSGNIKPRLLSVEQAAQYLNRSTHSVRHLVSTHKLRAVKLDGRIFLDLQDLDRAIEAAKE